MYDNNDDIANAEDEDIKPEHIGVIWRFFFQRALSKYFWDFSLLHADSFLKFSNVVFLSDEYP